MAADHHADGLPHAGPAASLNDRLWDLATIPCEVAERPIMTRSGIRAHARAAAPNGRFADMWFIVPSGILSAFSATSS
jgi:hypothetical protein